MKILLINKFHYLKGGSERSYFDLGELLEKSGHQVAYFSTKDPRNKKTAYESYFIHQDKFDSGGVWRKIRSAFGILYNFTANRKLKKLIQDFKPDIAHLHNIYHQISPSIIKALKKEKIPVVLTIHDYKIVCPNYKMFNRGKVCDKCLGGKYYNCFYNKCSNDSYSKSLILMFEAYLHRKILKSYEQVDLFIAPSNFVKEIFIKGGFPENKIKVLNHFINSEVFIATDSGQGEDYILYFGRISEEKGIDILLKTAAELPEIKFKIAGEANNGLENKYKNENYENVEFLGYKKGKELSQIIRGAKAIIFPSIWNEVFGYSIIEALSMGKAVIASKIGAVPEIIKDNYNGILFKPGDFQDLKRKIELLNNNLLKIEENAKKSAISYNLSEYKQKIVKIYNSLQGVDF